MKKEFTYKEPSSYFNKDMKKAASEWEKKNKETKKSPNKTKGK